MCGAKRLVSVCQILAFLTFLVFVQTRVEQRITYHGDQVLQVTPKTKEDVEFLENLLHNDSFKLDFWTHPSLPTKPVDIHVRRQNLKKFKQLLKSKTISFRVKTRNLQRLINGERTRFRSAVPFDAAFHSYYQIVHEMKRLEKINENLVKVFTLGKTYENRTMYGIKISSNITTSNKSVMFLNCGIHAREWISISTCMYIARALVRGSSQNSSVADLVDKMEWIIVPVVNVDGYNYARTTNRLWRKNRSPNGPPNSTECVGTDLNRNFNIKWAMTGAHYGKPCSPIYPGSHPFSEPETFNLARYMYKIRNRIKGYIDFHSYGQLWMSAWGFTRYYPPTYNTNYKAMIRIVRAIYNTNGTSYRFGPAAIAIYKTSGDATDWVYGILGVTHSYGVELPPSIFTRGGFVLPPHYIQPVGRETFAGLKALAYFLV